MTSTAGTDAGIRALGIGVLVVEDDPLIAQAHRSYVERLRGFTVVGVADCGAEALRIVAHTAVDLVLLDFYLPDMGGLEVCRALRAGGAQVDIIAVTSARDLAVVRGAIAFGVVQYLLKPFSFGAFRARLESYADYRRQMFAAGPGRDVEGVAQGDVDRALAALREPSPTQAQAPKGLAAATLDIVIGQLRAARCPLSATDVANATGISRVTARRYLEHLVSQHLATRAQRYGTTGRPEFRYCWAGL